jgi:two-component system, sensor histidine kinase PdtaS
MTRSHLTSFGIPGISQVPYGIHMCQFYVSQDDLMDGLTPYFLAGVANNERCIWITAAPLPASEVKIQVGRSRPALARALQSGQLTIVDATEWHGPPNSLDADQVIQRWLAEEEQSIADGYEGLRITGNASFVSREDWSSFMEYEEKLHQHVADRRIVVCCSYHRQRCKPVDIFEIVHRHHGALDRTDDHWEVLGADPRR